MKQQAFEQVPLGKPQIRVQVLQVSKGKHLKEVKHLQVARGFIKNSSYRKVICAF